MTTNNQGVGTRELALMILLEIERGEKSHIVLRQVLEKYQYLSKQDRAFLTRLAEGTTERRIEPVSYTHLSMLKNILPSMIKSINRD